MSSEIHSRHAGACDGADGHEVDTVYRKTKFPTTASGKTPVGDIQGNFAFNSVRGEEENVNRRFTPDMQERVPELTDAGKYVFYNAVDKTPMRAETKEEPFPAAAGTNAVSAIQESSSGSNIRDKGKNVNRKSFPYTAIDRRKAAQFAVIQSSSAAEDNYHTWIRCAYKRDSLSRARETVENTGQIAFCQQQCKQ